MTADRVILGARLTQVILGREWQCRDVAQPAHVRRAVKSGVAKVFAVERRVFEQVGDLRAVSGIVNLGLLCPGTRLDVRIMHQELSPL